MSSTSGRAARRAGPGGGRPPRGPRANGGDARRRPAGAACALLLGAARPYGALLAAGVVDELFLTITPLVTGDEDEPNITSPAAGHEAVGLELVSVDRAGSELFLRATVTAS